jgi:hypothetical protein
MEDSGRNIRVWRVRLDSTAGIMLTPEKVAIISDSSTFLQLQPGVLNIKANRINILTQPENISKGLLFKENIGFMQLIPSTIPTPIPNVMINIPGAGLGDSLGGGLAACIVMLAPV